ncbi:MAG TPA: HlyD family secretion protein [Terriglobales bacterium]|nr:HlyD family secretion protein [Terriglobales bacterium]
MAQTTDIPEKEQPAQHPSHRPEDPPDRDLKWRQFTKRNPRLRMFAIVGTVALLVVLVLVWRYLSSYEGTDDAQIDGHLTSVSARVSGHVQKLLVEDNQYVTTGTPLLEIDPKDLQVAVERARANYADAVASLKGAQVNVPITSINTGGQMSTAEADVNAARAGISVARQQLDAARAQVQQAEANDIKAQTDLARYGQLVEKQEISRQQYDQAVAVAKSSDAGVQAAHANASAADHQVTVAQSKLAEAEANLRTANTGPQQIAVSRARAEAAEALVARAKAEVDKAELDLSYTTVIATFNGVVSNRTVEAGQNVQPGQELMKIVSVDEIWVTANFKETQLHHMRPGQDVTVSVDAYDREYKGKVQSIAGASGARFSLLPPENATGNYVKVVQRIPVKITLNPGQNNDHLLRPGMSVDPKVWIKE